MRGSMLIFGGSQAVRRFNAAVDEALPRLVERGHILHVTGDDGYAAALAARERLPADQRSRYRPYPFLRDDMLPALVAADLVVGRAGSSTLAEVTALGIPSVIVPYPHAAGHQTANAKVLAEAGGARLIRDEDLRCGRPRPRPPTCSRTMRRGPGWPRRPALFGRPGAADAVAELVMAAAERRPFPDASPDRSALARGDRVTAATESGFDPIAIGTAIQRRIGVKTVRDEPLARFTTMRVGGPADLFATAHNVHELRALIRFARSRELPHTLLGRGSNVVIADAGIRGLVIQDRAEGSKVDGDRYTAEAGVPMARAATETQKAGLSGLEFGLAIPGTVGGAVWANAGAHENDVAAVLESADVLLADGTEARLEAAQLDLGYRHSRFKVPIAEGAPGRPRPRRDVPPDRRARRRHQGSARRHPPLAPVPPAAGPAIGRQRVPEPGGRSVGRRDHRRARPQGSPDRRVGRVGEARQFHRQRPEGDRGRRPRARRARPGRGPRAHGD